MFEEFKKFLLQTNALALAMGVIIGGAIGKVVTSIVGDVLMPVIGQFIPGGEWRELKLTLWNKLDGSHGNSITYGALLGNLVDFIIIASVVFMVTKAFIKPSAPPAPTKTCPECLETVPKGARKCHACASVLA